MGMMPVYFSTTNTKKRKQKRKVGWQKAEEEHKAFLKKWGIDDTKPKKNRQSILVLLSKVLQQCINPMPCLLLIKNKQLIFLT